MSKKPIDSFFDDDTPNFRLWQTPNGIFRLDKSEIIFQAPLIKFSKRTGELRERFFVLTDKYLFYLFTPESPVFVAVMPTSWIRVDYLASDSSKLPAHCFRFVRNRRYTDLFAESLDQFEEWKAHFNRVFWQCNFQARFKAIKTIGKGSFAKVYLVKEAKTEREFAVKAFSKEHVAGQKYGRQSLMAEIDILRQLKHRNIMSLEELHESRNSIYMITELLEGGELLQHLTGSEPMKPSDQQKVIKALLEALAYMEEKMIMHRDIKPTNILFKYKEVPDFSKVKLVDFGLATFRNATQQIFQRCGTPGFIAPEVINCTSKESIPYSTNCDVFSVGVLMYIMLTGRSPFEGRNAKEILELNKVCKIDKFHPRLLKDKHAYDLLFKLLESNPDERPCASEALKHPFFSTPRDDTRRDSGLERCRARDGGLDDSDSVESDSEGKHPHHPAPHHPHKLPPTRNHKQASMTDDDDDRRSRASPSRGEKAQNSMKIYLESFKSKNFVQNLKVEGSSFGVQDHLFKGTLQTVDDSMNSQEAILSLKSWGSINKKEKTNEKQNMLKVALLNNAASFVDDIYQAGFTEENFDSDEEVKET